MIVPVDGLRGIVARYGALEVRGEEIVSPRDWEARWIVKVAHPALPRPLRVNRDIASPLREALDACLALGDGYRIVQAGCHAVRAKRGNSAHLSVHAWGLAVDLNADANPRGLPMRKDLPDGWIREFESRGWVWGGRFPTPDPMHFQVVRGY